MHCHPPRRSPISSRASRSGWKEINFALTGRLPPARAYQWSILGSTGTSLFNTAHPAHRCYAPPTDHRAAALWRQLGNRSAAIPSSASEVGAPIVTNRDLIALEIWQSPQWTAKGEG